jgi:hypothetical protein
MDVHRGAIEDDRGRWRPAGLLPLGALAAGRRETLAEIRGATEVKQG